MKLGMYELLRGLTIASACAFCGLLNPTAAFAEIKQGGPVKSEKGLEAAWQEFHSVTGKCSMKFPMYPEHVSESMSVPEEGYDLRYDAYISTEDKKTIYMLLVAQY